MLGAGFTYLTGQVKTFIQRQALIYGLMAVGGLMMLVAVAYGLDALRESLAIRVGGVYANLIVGGGLLIIAFACIGIALYLRRAPSPINAAISDAKSSLPALPPMPHVNGSAILAGSAVTGLVAGVLVARRSWQSNERSTSETNDRPVPRAPTRSSADR